MKPHPPRDGPDSYVSTRVFDGTQTPSAGRRARVIAAYEREAMKAPPRDGPDSDGLRSYNLAIRIAREQSIRAKWVAPRPDDPQEQRWAREGEKPSKELDTVMEGRW